MHLIDIVVLILFVLIVLYFTISMFTKPSNHNKVENFIVSDAQDFHNYPELRQKVLAMSDTFEDEKIMEENEKILEKIEPQTCLIGTDPMVLSKCENESIEKKFESGPNKLQPFPITCRNNIINDDSILTNPEDYYGKFYRTPIIPLEDSIVRGANYEEYSDSVNPNQMMNLRILSQNTKGLPKKEMLYRNIPVGNNYAFPNTPAMRM